VTLNKTLKPSDMAVTDPEMLQAIEKQMRLPRLTANKKRASKKGTRKRRTKFRTEWARIPATWRNCLRKARGVNTVNLAITLLFEAFRAEQCGGEIVLSAHSTGLHRSSRSRALQELEELGLVRVTRRGRRTPLVRLRRC
jgi:hypothetical protein